MPQIESVSDTSSSASSSPPASSSRHRDLIDNRRSSKLSLTLSRGALSQHSKTELAALLISEERESSKLRKTLLSVVDQLRGEAQRANDAERRALDSAARLRAMEDERKQARREAAKASEELRLYKMQLDTAQREILRAQGILESLEAERAQADESAARARSMARKMKEELLVDRAREEGRRQGIREAMAGRRVYVGGDDGERGSIRSRVSSVRNAADDSMLDFGPPIPPPAPIAVNVTPPPPPPAAVPPAPAPAPPPPPIQAEPIVIHTPTPPPPVVASPPPPNIHPVPVYNVPRSPSRADIDLVIPPDTFVPVAGADMSISLPPPHEMSRLVRSPETPYTGLPSSGVPPPPVIHSPRTTMTPPLPVPNVTTRRAHRHRREHSPDSASLASTTISQFDIVTEPGPSRPQSTSTFAPREQKRALSVIPEMPTPSARTEGSLRGSPAGKPATLRGSPAESTRNLAPVPEHATMSAQAMPPVADPPHYVYRRPSFADSTSSSASGPSAAQRSPSLRQSNRASSSSVPDINVEPPSRPGSLTPQHSTPLVPMGTFLTPEDAHRVQTPTQPPPPELPSAPPVPAPTQPVPAPTVPISAGLGPGGPEPIVLTGDQLPPGFVPNTPISPSRGAVPLPTARSAPVSTKVPAPASTSTSHRSKRGSAVVPDASLYAGPVTSSSDTDDSSLSSSLSRETLSTPPPRRPVVSTKKPKKTKGPAYQVAPDEPAYPLSPLMQGGPIPGRGLPGMSPATARVPLPPATVTSPRSSGSALSSAAYRTVSPSTVLSSLPAESVPAKGRGKNKKKR